MKTIVEYASYLYDAFNISAFPKSRRWRIWLLRPEATWMSFEDSGTEQMKI